MQEGRGTLVLVFGVLGAICCFPLGIAAWVMGSGDIQKMDRGEMSADERTITRVGMILGIVSVAIAVLGAIWTGILGGLSSLMAVFGMGG